jgi:TonB family protein
MKWLSLVVLAVLALASQTEPALASNTGTVTLIPLSSLHAGVASAISRCNKPAALDGEMYVDVPNIDILQGVTGTTLVRIDLNAKGVLTGESLFSSSGNPWLDRAALASPKAARFIPEMMNCTAVGGSYLYEVDF